MLNAADVKGAIVKAIEYTDRRLSTRMSSGKMNTSHDKLLENVRASIRRGHPQMRTQPPTHERICLVGSGPSLAQTERELRDLLWDGAILVTMNGAYHWCIDRNLRPQSQIVMDARPSNARFLQPDVPRCNYLVASQCDPAAWDAVEGRSFVRIFHAVQGSDDPIGKELDVYYQKQWIGVGGGVTVASRALSLLRMAGYVRFDLFGVDCCWDAAGEQHHAFDQPENAEDRAEAIRVLEGTPDERQFYVSPWMLKQFEDMLTVIAVNGEHLQLEVHGDGMLAHVLRTKGVD